MGNMVRVHIKIRGNRELLQCRFGPDAIPLEAVEKTGRAGNDPEEWKRSCMVADDGRLYIMATQVFGCIRDGGRHTTKGKSNFVKKVAATLQVEDAIIYLNRVKPESPAHNAYTSEVYVDVRGCVNKNTKSRNVRYRLAASSGWECETVITWDKTIVPREIMRAIVADAGRLEGIGDGRSIGCGRFEVIEWKELSNAEESAAA